MDDWKQQWSGKIWLTEQQVKSDGRVFERARRSPGSRLIIVQHDKVLLSKEIRDELGGKLDYRLPGGKVFNELSQYQDYINKGGDIIEASRLSACREALEEVGLVIDPANMELLYVDVLGATCHWDLIYWVVSEFGVNGSGAQLHEDEIDNIKGADWLTYEQAISIASDRPKFSESRSALALLTFASQQAKRN